MTEFDFALSGAGAADDTGRPRLSDDDYAERAALIRDGLAEARREGLVPGKQYQDKYGIWSAERQDAQDGIVKDLYNAAADVPCERQAVMAGGLMGAGKSTVLGGYAGIDQPKYLTISADDIKEEMAKRGMIPELAELSPMEASDLVREESSEISNRLATQAMKEGKNLIWDISMSRLGSVTQWLDALDRSGYSTNCLRGYQHRRSVGTCRLQASKRARELPSWCGIWRSVCASGSDSGAGGSGLG